jgi:hypothetical protein
VPTLVTLVSLVPLISMNIVSLYLAYIASFCGAANIAAALVFVFLNVSYYRWDYVTFKLLMITTGAVA